MATIVSCDKCHKPIPGKVYGGPQIDRMLTRTVKANGAGDFEVNISVRTGVGEARPDLCGGCFRELVMTAVRDPEPP